MESEILQKKVNILIKLRGYRMLGEEETNSDVTDIIVQERKSRKKLLIRVVTQSKLSSGSIGVAQVRDMGRELEKRDVGGILVAKGRFSPSARREASEKGIETLSGSDLPVFDLFKHNLVPKHEILPKEEREELLKKYRIHPWQLPLIKVSDRAVIMIGGKPGDILKITRNSPTAGRVIVYRYVIE